MLDLHPEPLTSSKFEPFGCVISTDHGENFLINEGTTRRYHSLAQADVGDGTAILSIFRGTPRAKPIEVSMLERHPLGSQAFFPLSPHPWLIVVAPNDADGPGPCQAFVARGDQGIQYARNVWHHPLLVLVAVQDFFVVDRHGSGTNVEEFAFPLPVCRIVGP